MAIGCGTMQGMRNALLCVILLFLGIIVGIGDHRARSSAGDFPPSKRS